jgi:hypothetical protein
VTFEPIWKDSTQALYARHNVTHVFNSWTEMPPVGEQMVLPGRQANPTLTAARFLLKPGRSYEGAVKTFQPYNETKEVNEEARRAGAKLIQAGKQNPKKRTFLCINNRLEGNALQTIRAMLELQSTICQMMLRDRDFLELAVTQVKVTQRNEKKFRLRLRCLNYMFTDHFF